MKWLTLEIILNSKNLLWIIERNNNMNKPSSRKVLEKSLDSPKRPKMLTDSKSKRPINNQDDCDKATGRSPNKEGRNKAGPTNRRSPGMRKTRMHKSTYDMKKIRRRSQDLLRGYMKNKKKEAYKEKVSKWLHKNESKNKINRSKSRDSKANLNLGSRTQRFVNNNFKLKEAKKKIEIKINEEFEDSHAEDSVPPTPLEEAAVLRKNINRMSQAQICKKGIKDFDETQGLLRLPTRTSGPTKMSTRALNYNSYLSKSNFESAQMTQEKKDIMKKNLRIETCSDHINIMPNSIESIPVVEQSPFNFEFSQHYFDIEKERRLEEEKYEILLPKDSFSNNHDAAEDSRVGYETNLRTQRPPKELYDESSQSKP